MNLKIKKGYIAVYSLGCIKIIGFLTGQKSAKGAAFFPFIFLKSKEYETPWIINHEKIHFRQQLELLFILNFLIRFFEKLYARFFLKKSKLEAYTYCATEQEAYLNQNNLHYLQERKLFAIFKYIKHKKSFIPDPVNLGELIFK